MEYNYQIINVILLGNIIRGDEDENTCVDMRQTKMQDVCMTFIIWAYFTLTAAMMSKLLHEELLYLRSNSTTPPQHSILEPNTTSETSIIFTILILSISSIGILTSLLLLLGLYWDKRVLLIPWMLTIIPFILVDMVHCIYLFIEHTLKFNPSSSILFTLDFFLLVINIYALLCVISQYQELSAGRGRANDESNRVPSIHYSTQPTATSFLRRAATYNETRASPTQSPTGTGPHTSMGTEEPSPNIINKGHRKSVKFPDHDSPPQNGRAPLEPWTIDGAKSPVAKEPDKAPLIQTVVPPPESKPN